MATLTIRNLDNKTVERLKQHARQNERSLEAEVRHILNNAAQTLNPTGILGAGRCDCCDDAAGRRADRQHHATAGGSGPLMAPPESNSPVSNVVPFMPRRLAVDASVAIKWYVAEDRSGEARALERFGNLLAAPDFLAVELANIAWKKARLKEIDPQHAA